MAEEMFVMLGWAWDIDTATVLASRHRPHHGDLRVLAWARPVIRIDPDHAAHADLSRPLLAVPVPDRYTPLVVDGWHRIHRAVTTGVTALPVILLDENEERACRIRGGGR